MHNLRDLVQLMARLRDPDTGCPWDLKQSFATVVPHTVEETYEVVDAIDRGDRENLCEELGDLLFQVVFYARLAEEEQSFQFDDVVDGIVTKLLRRHPHVFPDGTLSSRRSAEQPLTDEAIRANWEAIKQLEKSPVTQRFLDAVSRSQPPLNRAFELQRQAAKVGFDWVEVEPVIAKVREELIEVEEALAAGDREAIEDEIGDVLFTAVNLARLTGIDPDRALRRSNEKFYQRFGFIEQALEGRGSSLAEASLDEMELLWQSAKDS